MSRSGKARGVGGGVGCERSGTGRGVGKERAVEEEPYDKFSMSSRGRNLHIASRGVREWDEYEVIGGVLSGGGEYSYGD